MICKADNHVAGWRIDYSSSCVVHEVFSVHDLASNAPETDWVVVLWGVAWSLFVDRGDSSVLPIIGYLTLA